MALPISRVINVSLTRERFTSIKGFGVPMFLTTKILAGKLILAKRTRVYGSMAEVAAEWAATDHFYKAAQQAFSQNPRPTQIKVGYLGDTPTTSAEMATALDAIEAYDADWYWADVEAPLRDTPALDGLILWMESRQKLAVLTTNDIKTLDPNDTTCISARHKGTVERTGTFYASDVEKYPGFAFASSLGTFNFDTINSAYTGKFKHVASQPAENIGSAEVQGATGFTPALGQSLAAGHMANVYVNIGGQNLAVEGSTLTPNIFLDDIHSEDWLTARMEEEQFNLLLSKPRVAMDDRGMAELASAAERVMVRANRAGIIAAFVDPNTGVLQPAYTVIPGDVSAISGAQRQARIAPATIVQFQKAGAVHYATVKITATS